MSDNTIIYKSGRGDDPIGQTDLTGLERSITATARAWASNGGKTAAGGHIDSGRAYSRVHGAIGRHCGRYRGDLYILDVNGVLVGG